MVAVRLALAADGAAIPCVLWAKLSPHWPTMRWPSALEDAVELAVTAAL